MNGTYNLSGKLSPGLRKIRKGSGRSNKKNVSLKVLGKNVSKTRKLALKFGYTPENYGLAAANRYKGHETDLSEGSKSTYSLTELGSDTRDLDQNIRELPKPEFKFGVNSEEVKYRYKGHETDLSEGSGSTTSLHSSNSAPRSDSDYYPRAGSSGKGLLTGSLKSSSESTSSISSVFEFVSGREDLGESIHNLGSMGFKSDDIPKGLENHQARYRYQEIEVVDGLGESIDNAGNMEFKFDDIPEGVENRQARYRS